MLAAKQGVRFTDACAAAPVCTPLFDLSNDPGENLDRRSAEPATFARIRTQYQTWNAQMLPKPIE